MSELKYGPFGDAALRLEYVSEEQLEECLKIQGVFAQSGIQKNLSEVLEDKEYLSAAQAKEIHDELKGDKKQLIKGYRIESPLGKGGMGIVYKAIQESLDKTVALKILPTNFAANEDYVARFIREAKSAGKLNHPNIMQAIDVGESGGFHYFVMEFVDGITVKKRLEEEKVLTEEEALEIVRQCARGLEHAQENNIVHRDIKPDNIMLTRKGVAKLCDLGLAKSTTQDAELTQVGVALGTPYYISPEQARGQEHVDTRSDIYSLGVTLFHMVTGQVPFYGTTPAVIMTKHITDPMPDPRDFRPSISPEVCQIIIRMTEKDPADRFQTAAEVAETIESIQAHRKALAGGVSGSQTASAATLAMESVSGKTATPTLEQEAMPGTTPPSAAAPVPAPQKSRSGLLAFVIIAVLVVGGVAIAYFSFLISRKGKVAETGATGSVTVVIPASATGGTGPSVTPRTATSTSTGGHLTMRITGTSRTATGTATAAETSKTGTSTGEATATGTATAGTEKDKAEKESLRAFAALQSYASTNPGNYDRILEDAENIAKKYPGTPGAKKAEELSTKVKKKRDSGAHNEAANREFAKFETQARMLLAEKKFDEAFRVMTNFREKYAGTLAAGRALAEENAIKAAKAKWEEEQARAAAAEIEKKFEEIRAGAQKLAAERKFSDALTLLDNFTAMYPDSGSAKRAEEEKKNITRLRDEFYRYYKSEVDRVSKMLGEGEYAKVLEELKRLNKVPDAPKEERARVMELFKAVKERLKEELLARFTQEIDAAKKLVEQGKYEEAREALKEITGAEEAPEEIRKEASSLASLVGEKLKEVEARRKMEEREKTAARLLEDLANYIEEKQWKDAMEGAHRLLEEFADTEVVTSKRSDIVSMRRRALKNALNLTGALRCEVDLVEKPRRVRCVYNFSSRRQKFDWIVAAPAQAKDEPDVWSVVRGILVGGGKKGYRWRGRMRGDIEIKFKLKIKSGGMTIQLYTAGESGYEFSMAVNAEFEITALGAGGKRKTLARSRGLDFKPGKQADVSIKITGAKIIMTKDGKEVISASHERFRSGPITFWALDSEIEVDDLVITGELDPNWLSRLGGK